MWDLFWRTMRSLLGRGKKSGSDASWSVGRGSDGDKPLIFRVRDVPGDFKRCEYPQMIAVTWRYQSGNEGGMPSKDEKQRMDLLEDLLADSLERDGQAILTVVVTGNGVREWQWYSRSSTDTMTRVNAALAGQARFPVEFCLQDDPAWEAYNQFRAQS